MNNSGGQVAIRGFLYQILCSLGQVARLALTDDGQEDATLTLEPPAGDLAVAEQSIFVVEQFKSRRTSRAWTTGELIKRVLPDLLDAARTAPADTPLRLRFVTDGTCQVDDLQRFLALVRSSDARGVLNMQNHNIPSEGALVTPVEYLSTLAERLQCRSPDDKALLRLLSALEIVDKFDVAQVTRCIDAVLGRLVDAREEIEGKRNELVGRLFEVAQHGGVIEVRQFLGQAGLNVARLGIVARLPSVLETDLTHACRMLGYEPSADVRPLSAPSETTAVFVIAGEGGQGKSWTLASLAYDLQRRGDLVILLSGQDDLQAVERAIVGRIWHSVGFDRPSPISVVAERLSREFRNDERFWLTVCLDDVQNARLLRDIARENWARLGIRLIASASSRLAERIAAQCLGAQSMTVTDFSMQELRRYLRSRQLEFDQLPDDVVALLRRPILANLYGRVAERGWLPHNEYVLIDRFWKRATDQFGEQSDHPSDKHHLKRLAASVLATRVQYPWPDAQIRDAELSDEARLRLIDAGLLQAVEGGVAMGHDRLLNWAVAVGLCDAIHAGRVPVAEAGDILRRIFRVDGDWTQDFASRRLGYVPMDLLWLLLKNNSIEAVAQLIRTLCSTHDLRVTEEDLCRQMLPTLGVALLPAVPVVLKQPLSGEHHRLVAREIGQCLIILARDYGVDVSGTVTQLLDLNDRDADTAALTALSIVPVPALLDRVWAIHLHREADFASESREAQARKYFEVEESFAALVPSAREDPEWIARTVSGHTDRKDQLVYLLLRLPHEQAKPLWVRLRPALFVDVTESRGCLAQGLRAFGSDQDIDFIERWILEGGDKFEQALRFDALVRLAPWRALNILPVMRQSLLTSTTNWWLPGLFLPMGAHANAALLAAFDGSFEGIRDLAIIYQQWQEQLDATTLRRILDMLADKLAEMEPQTEWRPGGVGHLMRLGASLYRPDLLLVLAEYRGSRLEMLLLDRAVRLMGRNSLSIDWDSRLFRDLLFKLGGHAFGRFVLAELHRESEFARIDGLRDALLVSTNEISARIRDIASGAQTREEQYNLVNVLAIRGERASVLTLLRSGAGLALSALPYLEQLEPLGDDDAAKAIADLADSDEASRKAALMTLGISRRRDVGAAIIKHLQSISAASAEAIVAVFAWQALGVYDLRLNQKLTAMLGDERQADRVAQYLLEQSEPEAHAPLLAHFANHALHRIRSTELSWAFALLRFQDGAETARTFLRRLGQRPVAFGMEGYIQRELLKAGDEAAREALYELAWRTARRGNGSAAEAISALATFDPETAFEAAQRQLWEEFDAAIATHLFAIDAVRATDAVLKEFYLHQGRKDRQMIARLLRWSADPALLRETLLGFCQSNAPQRRRAASEILGWQKDAMLADCLQVLTRDVEKDVEDAALQALQRQRRQAIAGKLLNQVPMVPAGERFCLLAALTEATDPYLLQHAGDPLCLDSIKEQMPPGYELVLRSWLCEAVKKADDVKAD